MITEDYVSFEIAKLLKEKGFDVKCEYCYAEFSKDDIKVIGLSPAKFAQSLKEDRYPYVTLQTAMKWLREVHGIHINVFRYPAAFLDDNNEQHKPWWFQYTLLKPIKEIDIDSHMMNGEFESAEEAMGYAIKYCLENLI